MEVGQHFSGTNILVLVSGDKHNTIHHKCRNKVKKWAWTVEGGGSRPLKTLEALQPTSIKVQNRLHMRTNLHRKQETYLQGGENLYIKRYPHKAQVAHPGP